jgi:hypothetical protein
MPAVRMPLDKSPSVQYLAKSPICACDSPVGPGRGGRPPPRIRGAPEVGSVRRGRPGGHRPRGTAFPLGAPVGSNQPLFCRNSLHMRTAPDRRALQPVDNVHYL